MTTDSPVVVLFNSDGYEVNVKPGVAIPAGTTAILAAGSDGTNSRVLAVDSSGRQVIAGPGTAGTPAGGVLSIQGVVGGQALPISGTVTATNASTGATGASPPAQATYIAGLSTTSAPSYTNNQLNALSLTLAGALRIDGSAVTQPVSGTVTANAGTGTFTVGGTVAATQSGSWTVAATQSGTWNITNISGTVNLPTGAATETTLATLLTTSAFQARVNTLGQKTMANSTPVVIASDQSAITITGSTTVSGTVTANQGGTWTVQPGNTPNSTPWLMTISQSGTVAAVTGANALKVDGSAVTQPISGTITANAGSGTFTVGGTVAATQSGAWTVTANAGTGNFTVVQSTAANLRAQTASEFTTAAATGSIATLTGGAVTTAAPTYTTGQMNPLSLTTGGLLRVDASGTTQTVSGTVTANAGTGTFTVGGTVAATQSGTWNITNISGTVSLPTGAATETTLAAMSAKLPAALVGGRLDTNNGAWLGSTAPTVGQKTMANSLPITIASDQSALPISGTVTANAGTGTFTVGGTVTANAGTGNFTVVQTTATNLNAQVVPGPGSLANSWWSRITDGTNTAAVKAASAAAIATDPALVVAISPNNPVVSSTPDTTVTGTLGALNAVVAITPTGRYTVGGQITGTWSGTITAEGTVDGTTWFTVRTANKSTNDIIQTYTANDTFEFYSVAGCVGLRLRMSAYTSGTANIVLAATSLATDAFLNYSGTTNDTGPPQRHVSIGTLTNDGVSFHALYNSNTNPIGDEYALITREASALNDYYASYSPDPASYKIEDRGTNLALDFSGRLETHAVVGSDEGSFRDDFPGAAITTSIGNATWTNGSFTVTGTGFLAGVKMGDYIKKTADANTLYVRVATVDSDTSLTLETAYAGLTLATAASVKSNWIVQVGASGNVAVATSSLNITTGATNGVINGVIRRGDYGPVTCRILASVSQRVANQDIRIGFSDTISSLTIGLCAFVQFTGTSNTTVNFITSSSTAGADTQTTAVTLPSGTTATSREYKIDLSQTQATLSIDGVVVARNTIHLPGPYDNIALIALAANTAAASNTTLAIDYVHFNNVDRVQVDNDFNGEPVQVHGASSVGQPVNGNPLVVAGIDGSSVVRTLKTHTDGTLIVSSVDGVKRTYTAAITGLVPPATPTDIFTVTGSASATVRIVRIALTGTQTTGGQANIQLVKRSAANTGGTSTTPTPVPHDSNDAAASAIARAYTANPTGLGAAVGTVRSRKVFVGGTTANSDECTFEFGTRNSEALILRGTAQVLAINLNAATLAGNSFNISIEWTEE